MSIFFTRLIILGEDGFVLLKFNIFKFKSDDDALKCLELDLDVLGGLSIIVLRLGTYNDFLLRVEVSLVSLLISSLNISYVSTD